MGANESKNTVPWDRESWYGAYLHEEEIPNGYWITDIEGTIPSEITGTYFRNGPGRLDLATDDPVLHPFDAEGLLVSIAIKNGKAFFRSRYVATQERLLEIDAGKRLFRGAFGTKPKQGWSLQLHSKNAANTNVMPWKRSLWALYDCAQPYALDPYTLKTTGAATEPFLEDGAFFSIRLTPWLQQLMSNMSELTHHQPQGTSALGGRAVTAHPKYDAASQSTLLYTYALQLEPFSNGLGNLSTSLKFYELGDDFTIKSQLEYSVSDFAFVHEIAFTKNFYVLIQQQSPVDLDIWSYIRGQRGAVGSIKWKSQCPSKVHLIRRPSSGKLAPGTVSKSMVLEVPPSFVFHVANAFEEGENIVIDAIHYKRFPDFDFSSEEGKAFKDISPERQPISRFRRMICDLSKTEESFCTDLNLRAMEFPQINPAFVGMPYRFAYCLSGFHPYRNSPPQILTKLDTETGELKSWSPGSHYFAGEPIFLPKRNTGTCCLEEDDGWILSLCYNGWSKKSELIILDALFIERGPVATLKLSHGLPHGLHGIWTDQHFGPGM